MGSSLDSRYLPHINGLRAIAILGVLFYHLRAGYCPAGYFGVDLFLVISGFLLFRSLLKPGAEQGFHYGSYLLRKAWRIIPSWFVVSLVVCLLTAYLFAPSRAGDILKTARYSALFHADYYIDRSFDYFNSFSQQNPLLHYWYLSITQQMYLLAPLLTIPLLRRCSRRAAIVLLTVLSLLSCTCYVLTTSVDLVPEWLRQSLLSAHGAKTAYYHLVPRFWEFAAGFAVFLLPEFAARPRLRAALGMLGLGGVVASFYLYATGSPALYLTIICSLLALRYASTGPAAWLLGLKPVQALGTISFSLYLWHWPVMVFWKYCSLDATGLWNEAGMLALSLLLATLSWRFVECLKTPTRSGWRGTLLRCTVLLALPLIAVSSTKLHKSSKKEMVTEDTTLMSPMPPILEQEPAVLLGLTPPAEGAPLDPIMRLGVAEGPPRFIFMGDSHAFQLSNALHYACEKAGVRGLYMTNYVLPYPGLVLHKNPNDPGHWNRALGERILHYLEQHPEIRYVLIAQRWEYRMLTSPAASHEETGRSITDQEERGALAAAGLREWCTRLRALGKEVILLGDNPTFPAPYPLDEWERYRKVKLLQLLRPYRERGLSQKEHEEGQKHSLRVLRQLAQEGLAHLIDVAPALMENGTYYARSEGQFLYYDDNHLSIPGAQRAVNYLMPRLLNIMQPQQP